MLSMQMGKESIQNRKPMILVLAGSNGSGKSTIQTPCHDAGQYSADCVRYLLLSSFLIGEKRDLLLAGENGNYLGVKRLPDIFDDII